MSQALAVRLKPIVPASGSSVRDWRVAQVNIDRVRLSMQSESLEVLGGRLPDGKVWKLKPKSSSSDEGDRGFAGSAAHRQVEPRWRPIDQDQRDGFEGSFAARGLQAPAARSRPACSLSGACRPSLLRSSSRRLPPESQAPAGAPEPHRGQHRQILGRTDDEQLPPEALQQRPHMVVRQRASSAQPLQRRFHRGQ